MSEAMTTGWTVVRAADVTQRNAAGELYVETVQLIQSNDGARYKTRVLDERGQCVGGQCGWCTREQAERSWHEHVREDVPLPEPPPDAVVGL